MRHRLMLVSGLLVLMGSGTFIIAYFFMSSPITRQNCLRIKQGMTEAEVEAILGPASETKNMAPYRVMVALSNLDRTGTRDYQQIAETRWKGQSARISVVFVEGGTVAYASFEQTEETLQPKIWRLLRLD